MGPVSQAKLVAVPLQPPALRAIADDQQVAIIAGRLQQLCRPQQILDAFLRPKAADHADQPHVLR
jgi:hypothetical protein